MIIYEQTLKINVAEEMAEITNYSKCIMHLRTVVEELTGLAATNQSRRLIAVGGECFVKKNCENFVLSNLAALPKRALLDYSSIRTYIYRLRRYF